MNNIYYNIGIYVRESRDDNEENYETIETQRDLLIDYINKNKIGRIYSTYIDDNVSGSAFERRGLEKLKEDVLNRSIDMVVLKDLSRLGRNNAKTLLFLDFLEENGIRVITYDGRYDSYRDNDTVGIDTWYNERYIRDISRKIRASIHYKIQKGEYIGSAPYGYRKSDIHKNRLCIEPFEASVVKEVFEYYKQGHGYAYIAKYLNLKGYLPPSLRGTWNAISVKRILCNAVYTGDTVQGVSEKISFKSKKTRRIPPERWVVTKDTHEAIVSREEFLEIQRIRLEKSSGSSSYKGDIHLFKGLLFCGKCGSAMFARKRKDRYLGYICSTYAKRGSCACSSHHISETFLMQIICDEILALLDDVAVRARLVEKINNIYSNTCKNEDEIRRFELMLSNKQKQQEILYMDKLEGKISEQLFLRMNLNIENRILQIRNDIEKLRKSKVKISDTETIIEEFIDSIKQYKATNEILKLIIFRITVYEKEDIPEQYRVLKKNDPSGLVEVDFKFSPALGSC
ncbi:MAG: recombinase family protein [Clostridia bacterium]|nr:recombinase family protein [Clostridia bacterium]